MGKVETVGEALGISQARFEVMKKEITRIAKREDTISGIIESIRDLRKFSPKEKIYMSWCMGSRHEQMMLKHNPLMMLTSLMPHDVVVKVGGEKDGAK